MEIGAYTSKGTWFGFIIVYVKGSPFWPEMITIPENGTSFTKFRLKKSTKEPVGPKQYHVQFFCGNYQTMWVPSKTIFIYEGLENLRSYCEKLKLYVKSCKHENLFVERNLLKAFSKLSSPTITTNTNSKSKHWNQAILEADLVLLLERLLKFALIYMLRSLVEAIFGKSTLSLMKHSVRFMGAIIEDKHYDMKVDIDVKNENIEDCTENQNHNLNHDIISKRNFSKKKRGITNASKRMKELFDSSSPISSKLEKW